MKAIKKLFGYLKGYWKQTVITWILVLVESVCEILVAFFLQYLLKSVESGDMKSLVMWALILASIAVFAAVLGVLAGYFSSEASAGFGKNLRDAMFTKIQDFSFKNIDKFSTASIVTRTTTDVTNVQFAFMMSIRVVVRAPFMMVFSLIMAMITAPKIAWIFLLIIPFLFTALIYIAWKVHPTFVKIFDTYDDLNASAQENVDGIRTVKSFGREEFHEKKFNKVSMFICKNYRKVERILAFNGPIMNVSVFTAMILLSVLGANLIISSGNTTFQITQLSTLFTYVMMIMMSLMMLSQVYVSMTIAQNSNERILEIIEEKPDIVSKENALKSVEDGRVDFEDVTFAYNEGKNVLEGINLHFDSGKSYGIIGPTGSSKSSLVSLIARLYDVSSGCVKVAGHDVRDYDLKVLRDSVSVVLQKNLLFTGTLRDNLKWGKEDATDDEIFKALDLAQASDFVKEMKQGLDTMIVEGGNNVSGGQKQRLCIARALLKDPKILILDDSTSACDTHTDKLIREGLRTCKPEVTKFIISQRVISIMDCDEIVVMDAGGKILDVGDHSSLMKRCDVYTELFNSQQGGGDFDVQD